jgi:hypothetical protein
LYMRKLAALLFAVLAIAVIAAGCGGGGDSTGSSSTADTGGSSSESSEGSSSESGAEDEGGAEEEGAEESSSGGAPTKAAFIKEADKICTKADLKLSEEVVGFAKENGIDIEKEEEPSDDQKTEIYEQIVIPNIARQAEEIAALTPPQGDEEKVEEITSTLADEAKSAEEDPGNLDENSFEEASKKASEYGLTRCGA